MDETTLQQLSSSLRSQNRLIAPDNRYGSVQSLGPDQVTPVYTYSPPVQTQGGPVIPAADFDLRPAAYVDHGKN